MTSRCRRVNAVWSLGWILVGGGFLSGQDQTGAPSGQATTDQPTTDRPTISQPTITTDRPSITDSSIVVPRGYLQFENGFAETGNHGQSGFDFPETLARLGITAKTELRFGAPDYFQNFNTGRGFGSGWGDLSLGLKQQLVTTAAGFDASLVVTLSFPTGANILSSHGYDPTVQFAWSRPIYKSWTAASMLSVAWPTEGTRRNVTGQASFMVDRQLTGRWDTFVEYGGYFPQRGGPVHILDPGMSIKITRSQQIDFHFGVGLSSSAVDHFIGFGYSFQFQPFHRERRD